MKLIETGIEGLVVIENDVYADERGYFVETYNQQKLRELGLNVEFVQDNESKSIKGVLRGLHFQTHNPQGKLVRAVNGQVWDVAVDLREESPTYMQSFGVLLCGERKNMMYVPPRFAHGFVVLSEDAVFAYKCTELYNPESDSGIRWNSEQLDVEWPIDGLQLTISEKDKNLSPVVSKIEWSYDDCDNC